jgi:hypothetical protein
MSANQPDGVPQQDGVTPADPRSAGHRRPADPETDRGLAFQPTFGTLRRRRVGPPGSVDKTWPLILHPIIAVAVAIVALVIVFLLTGR